MRKLFFLSLLACLSLGAQQPPTVSIPVSTNWHFGPSSGITSSGLYAGYGGSFSQTLGVSPKTVQAPSPGWNYVTEGTYTLKFSATNYFVSYPGYYTAEIDFGTQELCETSGWGMHYSAQVTLSCPSSGYLVIAKALPLGGPVQGQQPLVIKFHVDGWTVVFPDPEKISLTFTPESQ